MKVGDNPKSHNCHVLAREGSEHQRLGTEVVDALDNSFHLIVGKGWMAG